MTTDETPAFMDVDSSLLSTEQKRVKAAFICGVSNGYTDEQLDVERLSPGDIDRLLMFNDGESEIVPYGTHGWYDRTDWPALSEYGQRMFDF